MLDGFFGNPELLMAKSRQPTPQIKFGSSDFGSYRTVVLKVVNLAQQKSKTLSMLLVE